MYGWGGILRCQIEEDGQRDPNQNAQTAQTRTCLVLVFAPPSSLSYSQTLTA